MTQQSWRAADFLGLTPGIDPRRSDKFYVLNGQNYIFDSLGPRSAFSNRYLTPFEIGGPKDTQGFKLRRRGGDRVFHFTTDSILEWSEAFGNWKLIFAFPPTINDSYRWTQGYLNGYWFFCHPAVGLLVYDISRESCDYLRAEGVPGNPIAITVNNGRLVCVTPDFHAWSAPSDGFDWVPRLGGPGYQRISDRVSGDTIMVTGYTKGTMTWTTGGVMRSEFSGQQDVFQHRNMNTEYRPVNSFCTCRIDDDTVIILDERGLFQSRGEIPTPFAPLFNEFLIGYIRQNKLDIGVALRMEWDDSSRLLYLSVSHSQFSPLYELAFVLYPPLDKWGQFNESHYGILPIKIAGSGRADDYFGFIDSDGRVRYWNHAGSREVYPVDRKLQAWSPPVAKPVQYDRVGQARTASSIATVNSFPTSGLVGSAGFIEVDSGGVLATPAVTGLSARVQLGLIRFDLEQANDQLTEIVGISVGNALSGDKDKLSADFALKPQGVSTDDWVEGFGIERFTLLDLNYVNHGIRVISSVDGASEFCVTVPELVRFDRATRYYSCSTVGIWHILELTALLSGEAFHLKSFELTATYAGRLS